MDLLVEATIVALILIVTWIFSSTSSRPTDQVLSEITTQVASVSYRKTVVHRSMKASEPG